ncbi:MAG: diguanylate cyclase, partial [Lachnospiraceae bacterium]|nr:diguanylate cyclase [Lachnospiraceae bacterium]
AKCIVEIFGYENVYRIGGDEFVIVARDFSDMDCTEYEKKFEDKLLAYEGEMKLSSAIGSAVYDKRRDADYYEVFKRADENMYKRKQEMKSGN